MNTRGRSQKPWQRAFVIIAAIVVGGFMLIFGVWSLLLPRSWCSLRLPPNRGGIDYKESHARAAEEVRR
jgi:hypothetical protein